MAAAATTAEAAAVWLHSTSASRRGSDRPSETRLRVPSLLLERKHAGPRSRSPRPRAAASRRTAVDSGRVDAKTRPMNPMTCMALLFVVSPRPLVPPDALPEIVEARPAPAAPPRWLVQAMSLWGGPWVVRPDLYDRHYIIW